MSFRYDRQAPKRKTRVGNRKLTINFTRPQISTLGVQIMGNPR